MHKYLSVLLIVISVAVTGCGESIYSSAENTNSKEATIDDFDFSFLKNECDVIIERYDTLVMIILLPILLSVMMNLLILA